MSKETIDKPPSIIESSDCDTDTDCLENVTTSVVCENVNCEEDPNEAIMQHPHNSLSTARAIVLLFMIFCLAAGGLTYVYVSFPPLDRDDAKYIKFPTNIEECKRLANALSRYTNKYFTQVYCGVFFTYLFLQTFAIPGSIFLSMISGYLFSFPSAIFLICFCSATGASFCYLISHLIGRRVVLKYFPDKVKQCSDMVERNSNSLLSCIIFLRITPILPNWFINIVSPLVSVDLRYFWVGTFIGVAPPSCVAIQAGHTLHELTSTSDIITWQSGFLLLFFALISIAPTIYNNRLKIAKLLAQSRKYLAVCCLENCACCSFIIPGCVCCEN